MKKQTFYKAIITDRRRRFPNNVQFIKSEGYIHSFTDSVGNVFEVAMEYDRQYRGWYATELTTGLGSRPLTAKTQEELLEKLSQHNLTSILKSPASITLAKLLKAHIESEVTNEQTNL